MFNVSAEKSLHNSFCFDVLLYARRMHAPPEELIYPPSVFVLRL